MKQETHFQIKGISQDLAYQLFNPQYAFEMRNIRMTPDDENSLLSMTNERGNFLDSWLVASETIATISETRTWGDIPLTVLGTGVFSDYCIVFATSKNGGMIGKDYILAVKSDSSVHTLYSGSLNFRYDSRIRTVCVYENENVQKIYWIDGVNVPRVANVAPSTWSNIQSFQKIDFLPPIQFDEGMTVTRTSGGQFPAGVIQYAYTYSDKNLQETNIARVSPLYYSTHSNKGAAPGEVCNTAFKITILHPDSRFDYIQLYVIVRTSLNAQPAVYRIANIPVRGLNTLTYTDNGTKWESYSVDELLGKQLSTFIPKIIASKDSTLFLGNYTITSPYISPTDLTNFKSNINLQLQYESLPSSDGDYSFNLQNGSEGIKTFRTGEYYRIGIQFQDATGAVSNVVYLKDIGGAYNSEAAGNLPIKVSNDSNFKRKILRATFPSLAGYNLPSNLKRVRLMMVDRTLLPKKTICQGVLCPTVYKVNDRVNNQPFAMSSWSMRGMDSSALVDGSMVLPAEAGAQWMADMPILPNTVMRGGEIINQTDSPRGIRITAGNTFAGPASMLIDTEGTTAASWYYLADAYIDKSGEKDPEYWKVIVGFGRTQNSTVITQEGCSEKFIKHPEGFYLYAVADSARAKGYNVYTAAGLKSYTTDWLVGILKSKVSGISYPEVIVGRIMQQWNTIDPFAVTSTLPITMLKHGNTSGADVKVDDSIYNTFDDAVNQAKNIPYFFVDHNIVTFHSPDVEANQSLIDNNPNIKYRVIGYTRIQKTMFDTYVTLERGPSTSSENDGLQSIKKNSQNGIFNTSLWKDSGVDWATYLWHRSLSLGNQIESTDGKIPGSYSRKVFSNIHYCAESKACTDSNGAPIIYGTDNNDSFPNPGTPRVFNSNEISALSLERQPNATCLHNKLVYYGNVSMAYSTGTYRIPKVRDGQIINTEGDYISDSAVIRYKSTPHVVIPMAFKKLNAQTVLAPSLPIPQTSKTGTYRTNVASWGWSTQASRRGYMWATTYHDFWRGTLRMHSNSSDEPDSYDGLLYIAELYQDLTVSQIYGDSSEENLSKHTWIPISDWVELDNNPTTITGYGDTFIGRWDCLKTYSFSEDDNQSYVDITSFIVESSINLESRYDNYKGISDATMVNPTKFNLFNPVYNQADNLFQYNFITSEESLSNFQNQVCWSEVKTLGEELDTWSQINVGNNIDFQGEYGELVGAANLRNNLYFLQDDAIYKLNYNTRVAISPSDGVPIQISNNYRVDPPLLIKQYCGTDSQDKIVTTPNFIYFFDPSRKRLYTLNARDEVAELSTDKGVNSLIKKLGNVNRLYYDPLVKDMYINFTNDSLAFNEDLMEFTSLYDYQGITSMFSLGDKTFVTKGNCLFSQREGDYNYFFPIPETVEVDGVSETVIPDTYYKPFYIQVLANQDPLNDKTYTSIEYTMVGSNDAAMSEATDENEKLLPLDSFDKLNVNTSYQEGSLNLQALRFKPSNLKRKFRLWRTDIPRATGSMDRMRDLWMKAKLSKITPNTNKYRINNINISYLPT